MPLRRLLSRLDGQDAPGDLAFTVLGKNLRIYPLNDKSFRKICYTAYG